MAGKADADYTEDDYKADSRTPCKYGLACYQKNPQHHAKFKHPPKRKNEDDSEQATPPKRVKANDEDTEIKPQPESEEGASSPENGNASESEDEESAPKSPGKQDDDSEEDEEEKEEELPKSPEDVKLSIQTKFLVEMPEDFYDLWNFCTERNKEAPHEVLSQVGLKLVGPYDVMSGKIKEMKVRTQSAYLCHWRFYYDPPEFQTVLVGSEDEFHIGYFRDDPSEMPAFLASMCLSKAGVITPMGDNIFTAISLYITKKLKEANPFTQTKLHKLQKELENYAKSKEYSIEAKTARMKARDKKSVAKSLHGAGIVVPYDKKTEVGYREIPETNANLRRMIKKVLDAKTKDEEEKQFDNIHELVTNVQFANDEGDPGMGLELGIDLFSMGGNVFHSTIRHLLTVAYMLLRRPAFGTIIQAHLQNRRKGENMSMIGN